MSFTIMIVPVGRVWVVKSVTGPTWALFAVAVFVTEPALKSAWVNVYEPIQVVDCPGDNVRPERAGTQVREATMVSVRVIPVRLPPPLLVMTML